jgi:hypothetical protein
MAIGISIAAGAEATGLTPRQQLEGKLLSDVPAGWSVITPLTDHNPADCPRYFAAPKNVRTAMVTFNAQGVIEEELATGPSVRSLFRWRIQGVRATAW